MYLIRRAAFRVAVSSTTPLGARARPLSTTALAVSRLQQKWTRPAIQVRSYSEEATKIATDTTPSSAQSSEPPAQPPLTHSGLGAHEAESQSDLKSENSKVDDLPPSNTLYVGNLFYEVTEDQIRKVFSTFGPLKKARIVYDNQGLSRGFGFVQYENIEDATAAIANLNKQLFERRQLVVQFHRERPGRRETKPAVSQREPTRTLFIGNLSFEMSDKDLNDLFREVRNVIDVRVAIDRRTGRPRGFAYVDFIDIDSATKAKEALEPKELYGRKLRLDYAEPSSPNRVRFPPAQESATEASD